MLFVHLVFYLFSFISTLFATLSARHSPSPSRLVPLLSPLAREEAPRHLLQCTEMNKFHFYLISVRVISISSSFSLIIISAPHLTTRRSRSLIMDRASPAGMPPLSLLGLFTSKCYDCRISLLFPTVIVLLFCSAVSILVARVSAFRRPSTRRFNDARKNT